MPAPNDPAVSTTTDTVGAPPATLPVPSPPGDRLVPSAASLEHLGSVTPPDNPARPGTPLLPFRAVLTPPRAYRLDGRGLQAVDMAQTNEVIHPDLPPVAVWGYGLAGHVTSPGPLLEVDAGTRTRIRWRNRLPGSRYPRDPNRPVPRLPFATAVLEDPQGDTASVQNELGGQGAPPQDLGAIPIGWTSVHLHGAHDRSDSDGWPDNLTPAGGEQLADYDNTYDNLDVGLGKVGELQWYHDHCMNGTRFHVYAGLFGGYVVRDPLERALGLPVSADEGEIVLIVQDRNIDVADGRARLLHKTTQDTAEFFGPLTLVNGRIWPRLPLRPEVYRLRILNGSNARAYRLHLVAVAPGADGAGPQVTVEHRRVLVVGTEGGLLWRATGLADDAALTLAPAERVDVLVDLSDLPDGSRLYLVNSAAAPFGGDPAGPLDELWTDGDLAGRNRFPWVMRLDVDSAAPNPGAPKEVFDRLGGPAAPLLNPSFRRLVHDLTEPLPPDAPQELSLGDHDHHLILLAETTPAGHLYLQEIVADDDGEIELQLDPGKAPGRYRVDGYMAHDEMPSTDWPSFYGKIGILPELGRWQVFTFINTTGDTHPMHIHQSTFQPLSSAGLRLEVDDDGANRYDPVSRKTSQPITASPDAGRAFEPHERTGWKDVLRIDPGNVVKVAIRFDIPGRYVYHCHVLEHEDTEMMRPFVVTVVPMASMTMPM